MGRNLTALGSQGGDRLALAKSLVGKDNPLVSRVMANRIWHYMFGRGIVPTTDDFGPMGQVPSNSSFSIGSPQTSWKTIGRSSA